MRAALATVEWPARLEILARRPLVVVDAAHNVASIEAFMATLDESFAARPRVLVFATTCDKDVRGMLAALVGRFERIVFTRYQNNPRGLPATELAAMAAELGDQTCQVAADPRAAWDAAREGVGPEGLIAITGSFFIAAEMRPLVLDAAQRKPVRGTTRALKAPRQNRNAPVDVRRLFVPAWPRLVPSGTPEPPRQSAQRRPTSGRTWFGEIPTSP